MKYLKCGFGLLVVIACSRVCAMTDSSGTRGGGNILASEFSDIAETTIAKISARRDLNVLGFVVDGVKLQKKFRGTKVMVSMTPLALKGKSTQAINDPQANTIVIDGEAWQSLPDASRLHLVIHELFGLTFRDEVSDLNYSYSNALFNLLAPVGTSDLRNQFKCAGTEPFWSAIVTRQSALFDYDGSIWNFPQVIISSAAGSDTSVTVSVQATNGRDSLNGFINRTYNESGHTNYGCSDGMSPFMYAYSFQMFLNGQAYTGCCEDADHPGRPD